MMLECAVYLAGACCLRFTPAVEKYFECLRFADCTVLEYAVSVSPQACGLMGSNTIWVLSVTRRNVV